MDNNVLIRVNNISKAFFGINALTDVSFDVRANEIHCLCGENGAGKSTLIKILTGAYVPDSGEIHIGGNVYNALNPRLAHELGIQAIYQETLLIPEMSVAENIFVGEEKVGRWGVINYQKLYQDAQEVLDMVGSHIDLKQIVGKLSLADQQYVKIAKALVFNPKVLIMDEPTTMFNLQDEENLLELANRIKENGIGIVYITHKLQQLEKIADRVTVLRDGITVSSIDIIDKKVDIRDVTKDMVGRPVDVFYGREKVDIGETVLEVKDIRIDADSPPVSFNLRKGEILGFAGMVGSGRSEIMQALYGNGSKDGGSIAINGKEVEIKNPEDALNAGLCFITEDRQKSGIILELTVAPNITLPSLNQLKNRVTIDLKEEMSLSDEMSKKVNLKSLSENTKTRYLSGGNQQKVIIGKWLFKNSDIFIFDEPTRGIDVNSKTEIYGFMVDLVRNGKSILLISSDMPELISLSDRVLIVKEGAITGELNGEDITEENTISKMI